MGRHSAPAQPAKVKIPIVITVVSHKATHVAGIVVLHVAALSVLGYLTPVLTYVGITSGATH